MAQLHVTNQHLHIRTCQLIRLSFVSMEQVNFGLFILRLLLVVHCFLLPADVLVLGAVLDVSAVDFVEVPPWVSVPSASLVPQDIHQTGIESL